MNTLTPKCAIKKYFQCNKQHSKSNNAKVKKEIHVSSNKQCKSNYFSKATFKPFKPPKVHFNRTRSIKIANASNNNAQEAITQYNEGMQNQTTN